MDLFKLNRPFFDKDGGAAGGPAPEPKKETDDGAGGKKAEEAGKEKSKAEVTFTPEQQALVDRLVGEARTKSREQAKAELEAESAKAKERAEKKALEDQGEFKKLAERSASEAEQAKAAKEAAESALKNERIRYAVLTQAMSLSFAEPEDAMKLLDFSDVEFAEDGRPKADTITKKLEELVKAKPYLVKSADEKTSFGTPKKKTSIPNAKEPVEPRLPAIKF